MNRPEEPNELLGHLFQESREETFSEQEQNEIYNRLVTSVKKEQQTLTTKKRLKWIVSIPAAVCVVYLLTVGGYMFLQSDMLGPSSHGVGDNTDNEISESESDKQLIENYLNEETINANFGGEIFSVFHIFDSSQTDNEIYIWAFSQEYYYEDEAFKQGTGWSIPMVLQFEQDNGGLLTILGHMVPRDGSYYTEDIKAMFPSQLHNEIFNFETSPHLNDLQQSLDRKVIQMIVDHELEKSNMEIDETASFPWDNLSYDQGVQQLRKVLDELEEYATSIDERGDYIGYMYSIDRFSHYLLTIYFRGAGIFVDEPYPYEHPFTSYDELMEVYHAHVNFNTIELVHMHHEEFIVEIELSYTHNVSGEKRQLFYHINYGRHGLTDLSSFE